MMGIAVPIVFSLGCIVVDTETLSFTDPSFAGNSYDSVVVFADVESLQLRSDLETNLSQRLEDLGIYSIISTDILSPTRQFDEAQFIELVKQREVVALVKIEWIESGMETEHVPQTSSYSTTRGQANTIGRTTFYSGSTFTSTPGGYTLNKPWARLETSLFDVNSGMRVWVAGSTADGTALADWDSIVESYCAAIAKKLLDDGILVNKPEVY